MRDLPVEHAVARIAARQHGVITVDQLRASGLARSSVSRRVAAGRLHPVHRGVYAVGHPGLSERGRWKAATLACGGDAALSHRSAAELWGILPVGRGPIHVTVSTPGGRAQRAGLVVHRRAALGVGTRTGRDGIPVTRPGQTLTDLRSTMSPGDLDTAARTAEKLNLPLGGFVWDRTGSALERRFLTMVRKARLPAPECNARIGRFVVDFLWRAERLVVETDGWRYHRDRGAFEDDRVRSNALTDLGYEVLRFTHRQLTERPREAISLVRARLRARSLQPGI